MGLLVLLGVSLIVISRPDTAEASPPLTTDHWHASYGVYTCGEFQPAFTNDLDDESGVHSHGDGLIHIHPFFTRFTGGGASLGRFFEESESSLREDEIDLPGADPLSNGDDCGGAPGRVRVKVWTGLDDEVGRFLEDGDVTDYVPQDGEIVTIGFVSETEEDLPKPPSAGTQPNDLEFSETDPSQTVETLPVEDGATAPGDDETVDPLDPNASVPETDPDASDAPDDPTLGTDSTDVPAEGEAPVPDPEAPAPEGEGPAPEGAPEPESAPEAGPGAGDAEQPSE